jgi:transposase
MVHLRRGFYDFWVSTQSPLAADVLARIRELYAIEAEIRGHPAEHRQRVRDERSRPIVEALHGWMREHVDKVSAASDLAKAIRYAIRHWPGLAVFLDDGRVEMDSNVVERAIRPSVLTRKNALFAGSDGGARHWAVAMTLIQTAKLNGVDPMAWLADVLERIVSGRTKASELHTLLPWTWARGPGPRPRPTATLPHSPRSKPRSGFQPKVDQVGATTLTKLRRRTALFRSCRSD